MVENESYPPVYSETTGSSKGVEKMLSDMTSKVSGFFAGAGDVPQTLFEHGVTVTGRPIGTVEKVECVLQYP